MADSNAAPRDCQHGQLARQCPLCEGDADRTDYAAIIREALASWEALGARPDWFNRQSVSEIFALMRKQFDVARCTAELRPINPAAARPFPPGPVLVVGCRPEDRAMLATPAGQELVSAAARHIVTEGRDFDVGFHEAPKPGEWIEWKGGACPVHPTCVVAYRMRVGEVIHTDRALNLIWQHEGEDHDIVAYRVVEVGPAKGAL